MPKTTCRSALSRKTSQASDAVKTPSMFNKSEDVDAGVCCKPNIKSNAPAIAPDLIAPASQCQSLRTSDVSTELTCRKRRAISKSDMPTPEPK